LTQDDLDDSDIAAFSFDMQNKADEFKTIGMQKIEKEEDEKRKVEAAKKAEEEKAKKE